MQWFIGPLYTKAKNELKKFSFTHADSDHAVFTYSKNGRFCIIVLYVNDLLILSNDLPLLQKKKSQLMTSFKMKDLGKIHWFLGLEITCNWPQCLIFVSQSHYITDVVSCFGFSNSHHISTSMASDLKLALHGQPEPTVNTCKYQSCISSVMYAMLGTCLDIGFVITKLSQYLSNPGKEHWTAINCLLHYLNLSWDALQVDLVCSDDHYCLLIPPLFQPDPVCLLNRYTFTLFHDFPCFSFL